MKRKILILLILLVSTLWGCTQNSNQSHTDNQLPTSLLNTELTEQRIVSDLENIYELKIDQQNYKSKQSKRKQSESKQSKSKAEDPAVKIWQDVNDEIKKLHQNWNQYKSQSSIADQKLKLVDQKLNYLTETAHQQKLLLTLLQISQFNLQLAEIYNVYDVKKGQLKKSEGYIRNIIYQTRLGADKEKVLINVDKLKETVNSLQEKEGTNQSIKEVITAITDLERAIQADNNQVIEVKGELILDKLDLLTKESG